MRTGIHAAFRAAICLAVAATALSQTPKYDLLLKGGHVIDPKNGVDAVMDVAIRGNRIAAVNANLSASQASKTIDVSNLYVTPGLVDIHVHVFVGAPAGVVGADGDDNVYPDQTCLRLGVTTVVDAGGAGWRNFAGFRRSIIDRSKTRVLAMLNVVGIGMYLGDAGEQNPADMDTEKTVEVARKHSDVVVGIKSAHWRAPNFISVEKAVEAGKLANIPVMVDFGYFLPERPYQQLLLDKLRPGDITTHFYRWPAPILDANEKLLPYLAVARRRGVIIDVGHGAGSFYFRQAEPAVKQGFWPDSISTDLHSNSINLGMVDMLNVMSKFLAMGIPLREVIRQSTTNPATEIKRPELGHLSVGAEADVAVLRLDRGKFGFVDVRGGQIEGKERLGCELTIRAGKIVFDVSGRAGVPWRKANIKYPTR
jgi:dihydroorotase